jgi:hypothetical protein
MPQWRGCSQVRINWVKRQSLTGEDVARLVIERLKRHYLKGQSHEIFDPGFFSANNTPVSPDS